MYREAITFAFVQIAAANLCVHQPITLFALVGFTLSEDGIENASPWWLTPCFPTLIRQSQSCIFASGLPDLVNIMRHPSWEIKKNTSHQWWDWREFDKKRLNDNGAERSIISMKFAADETGTRDAWSPLRLENGHQHPLRPTCSSTIQLLRLPVRSSESILSNLHRYIHSQVGRSIDLRRCERLSSGALGFNGYSDSGKWLNYPPSLRTSHPRDVVLIADPISGSACFTFKFVRCAIFLSAVSSFHRLPTV